MTSPKIEHESFIFKGFREVRTDGADVGNTFYSVAVIPSTLFALKAGQHRLGPAEVNVRVLDTGPGFGGGLSSFFQRTVLREMVTNTTIVTVKPLPAGAPASFTGGVGTFSLTAKASTNEVGIGDPISMEFEVSGVGNLRTMGPPAFEIPQTGLWKSYEPSKELSDENDSDGFNIGRAAFSQVIIPEARVKEIPVFQLTYFDPSKLEYITLRTDPIPITVNQDRTSGTVSDLTLPATQAETGSIIPATRPNPEFSDVMYIRTGAPKWIAANSINEPGTFFYLIQALFSILFFTVTGFGLARGFRFIRQRRMNREIALSFSESMRRIPGPGSPRRDFFHAVAAALAQWRIEHPNAPEQVNKVIERITDRCASVLYSGMSEPDTPVSASEVDEFTTILKKLPR